MISVKRCVFTEFAPFEIRHQVLRVGLDMKHPAADVGAQLDQVKLLSLMAKIKHERGETTATEQFLHLAKEQQVRGKESQRELSEICAGVARTSLVAPRDARLSDAADAMRPT